MCCDRRGIAVPPPTVPPDRCSRRRSRIRGGADHRESAALACERARWCTGSSRAQSQHGRCRRMMGRPRRRTTRRRFQGSLGGGPWLTRRVLGPRQHVASPSMAGRVDANGAAYAGSQMLTQLYVNARADDSTLPSAPSSRNSGKRHSTGAARRRQEYAEYWDAPFLGRLGLADHVDASDLLASRRAALGRASRREPRGSDAPGVLLVEGKSYPGEMLEGSAATSPADSDRACSSRVPRVDAGPARLPLRHRTWTGRVPERQPTGSPVLAAIARGAHLAVHLLFTGDPRAPTTEAEWEAAALEADERLGLSDVDVPGAGHLAPRTAAQELLSVAGRGEVRGGSDPTCLPVGEAQRIDFSRRPYRPLRRKMRRDWRVSRCVPQRSRGIARSSRPLRSLLAPLRP